MHLHKNTGKLVISLANVRLKYAQANPAPGYSRNTEINTAVLYSDCSTTGVQKIYITIGKKKLFYLLKTILIQNFSKSGSEYKRIFIYYSNIRSVFYHLSVNFTYQKLGRGEK